MVPTTKSTLSLVYMLCMFTLGFGHDTILVDSEVKSNLRTRHLAQDLVTNCHLDVDIRCSVVDKSLLSVSCDDFEPPELSFVKCTETPISATMLLRGDRCDEFAEHNDLNIECQDHGMNSVSLQEGDWLFIVATDADGQGIVYHRDWVRVGDRYELTNELPLEFGLQIYTFDDEDETNLLQTVTYSESLCSHESELLALLGGSQIVGFMNAGGDIVTPFQSSSYEVYVDVSILSQSHKATESVELESLTIMTTFQGLLDFSEEAKGNIIEFGYSYKARIPLTVNLLEKQDHSLLVHVSGNSGECVGAGFHRISDAKTISS